jgi:hypothetical protein
LSILVRDIPSRLLVTMPHPKKLDYVPAAHGSLNVDSLLQAQISARSPAECFGSTGINESVGELLLKMSDKRAIV